MKFNKNYRNFLRRINPLKQAASHLKEQKDEKLTFLVKRTVKQRLEAGREQLEKGCVEEAIDEYNAAVDLDPKCGISQFNLAYAYHEDGQYEMAREHYVKAIEIEPACPYFLEHLARLNFETLEYSEAARLFHRASTIGQIQPLSIGLWGRALFEQSMYEESIHAFQQLMEREQQKNIHVGAKYWQIMANIKLERMAAARKLVGSLIKQKRADYKILYDLGENFIEARCLDIARQIFEKIAIEKEEFLLSRLRLEDIRMLELEIDEMLPGLFVGDEEKLLYHIHAMMEIGDARVSKALLSQIDHSSALVRESVIGYQTKFGFNVSEHLDLLLSDPVDFVRNAAYDYFNKLDDSNFLEKLSLGIDDPHIGIREKSASFTGRFASIEFLPTLEMATTDTKNKEILPAIRQAITSIKNRYQKNIDSLYKKSASDINKKKGRKKESHWKFWLAIFIQSLFIAYFIYYLFIRL